MIIVVMNSEPRCTLFRLGKRYGSVLRTGKFLEQKLDMFILSQVAEKLPCDIFTGISTAFVHAPIGIRCVIELPF